MKEDTSDIPKILQKKIQKFYDLLYTQKFDNLDEREDSLEVTNYKNSLKQQTM
jgi:hypothetical protein